MNKRMGFDKKIIICVSLLTAVVLFISSGAGFIMSRNTVSKKSKAEILNELEHQSAVLSGWITEQQALIAAVANSGAALKPGLSESRKILISTVNNSDGIISDAYISFPDNTTFFTRDIELPPDFDVRERVWYIAAKETHGKPVCTSPYIDFNTGNMVITVAAASYNDDGTLYGIAGGDVYIDDLINTCSQINISENAYPFLIDDSGNILVHENSDFLPKNNGDETVFTNISEINAYKDGIKIGETVTQPDYDGKKHVITAVKLSNGWILGYSIESGTYNEWLLNMGIVQTVITISSVLIATILITAVIKSCLKPVISFSEAADNMANGNFTFDIDYSADDELGSLAESMRKLCRNNNSVIADLEQILKGMENGDLTTMSKNAEMYKGDYFKLITSIRNFREKIHDTLSNINNVSYRVLNGSDQVSSGSRSVSQGTTEQASSVEELAATIHEVRDRIKENARSAESAMNSTNEAGNKVKSAADKMTELVKAMNHTKECSDKIGKIIKTIEDIAFQTNILALNAAVEAARAGAAGKGFAVVADEVRNLAAKSAEAASSTNTLIAETIASVDRGNGLVNEAADMMSAVSSATSQVSVLNTNIYSSSADIAKSIEQINSGVEQISGVVQTNAATAEQSAAASEELSGQAHTLKQLVDEFVLR